MISNSYKKLTSLLTFWVLGKISVVKYQMKTRFGVVSDGYRPLHMVIRHVFFHMNPLDTVLFGHPKVLLPSGYFPLFIPLILCIIERGALHLTDM